MRKALALGAFLPDQNDAGLDEAANVYPLADGYGPMRDFAPVSDALAAAFKGGGSFTAADGSSFLLAGTMAGLARYSSGSWADLLTGMSVAGRWRFAQFGDKVLAVNGVDTKVVDLVAGTAASLTDAPAGIAIAVVGDYVVIAQASDDLLGIYTSGFNDYTDWNPAGSGGATIQPMLTGGEVMGLEGGEYGVILQRQRIVRMTRTGDSTQPFQFDEISANVGCASKASVAAVGRTVFFLSDRGFMGLDDGQVLKPIGSEKVDQTFQRRVARDDYERLFSAIDPQNKLVVWCVPGSPGTLWIYNFELDRWSTGRLAIEGVFAGFTSSETLEAVSATYSNLDTMPYSLDDPRFSGGNPRLYAVQNGVIGTFAGSNLEAAFGLPFGEPTPGRRARVRSLRPIGDMTAATATLDCRARIGDAPNVIAASSLRASGAMPVRAAGRYVKPRLTIPAGTTWSYAQGLELETEAAGER